MAHALCSLDIVPQSGPKGKCCPGKAKKDLPFSTNDALLGGTFLVLCDTLARTLMMGELPVSIVTSILGAPYLIYLLRQNRKVYFE